MRSSSAGLVLALALVGCAPAPEPVFVDLARVLRETEIRPLDKPVPPQPPAPQSGFTTTMEGKAATTVPDRAQASGQEIRQRITDAQAQAFRDIQNRLRKFYETDLNRFELDERKLLAEADAKAYEEANERIRAEFEEYGRRRGPVLAQLTLLAGFPDPNPNSRPPDVELSPVLQRRFERTVELREELRAMDLAFDHSVQQILAGVQDLSSAQLAQMRLRVEQYRIELNRRAEEEARAQVRETAGQLGLKLIDPVDIRLEGTTPYSVSIPAEKPLRQAPEVPSEGILSGRSDREKLIRHEVDVWLGLNRYRLESGSGGVQDKTDEFLTWREKFRIGR